MIEIRELTPETTALLENVAEDVFDAPIHPQRLARYLAAGDHLMLLASDGDVVVGQIRAMVHFHPDEPAQLYIDNLGVAPAWQRRGIARQLVAAMLEKGREYGCEAVWVGTEADNDAANALYGAWATGAPFLLYQWKV
jgi:ribosomal protein S18 acetylase RimI-like enzyme